MSAAVSAAVSPAVSSAASVTGLPVLEESLESSPHATSPGDANSEAAISALRLEEASSSRSALIAASLFASPGLVACGDDSSDSSNTGSPVTDAADDTAGDTAADTAADITVPDDMTRALYGMPADVPMDMGPCPWGHRRAFRRALSSCHRGR